jgi:hypothetical protein
MSATTIHLTYEHRKWIDEKSLNLSKYVRKLLDKEMFDTNFSLEKNNCQI